jgi:hypothetical protein
MGEAVRILGLSATTIRRKIDAGELEAERVPRPQGTAFLVKVPADAPAGTSEAPGVLQDEPRMHQDAPAGTDQIATILVPLVAQIDALRRTVERQAEQLITQAETIGRLQAENDALRAAQTPVTAPETASIPDPPTEPSAPDEPVSAPWWRRWLLAVYGW